MAATTVQRRNVMTLAAVLLVVCICSVESSTTAARVTQFTFYPAVVPATLTVSQQQPVGSSASFRCRVEYNSTRTPTVRFRKTVNRVSFELATNDDINTDGLPPLLSSRVVATIIDNNPNGIDVYQWNINDLTASDTGNYSCYVGTGVNASSATVSLNVTVEPSLLSLYVNSALQPQSLPGAITKKLFNISTVYNVACAASGGNPSPNVTIYIGSNLLQPISTTYNTTVSSPDALGVVTRSTLVNATFTMNVSYIGVPITCYAGVVNPNGTNTAIIPIAESVVPHFRCQDKFFYQPKQSSISLECKFIGSNVTSHSVRWRNATANMTVVGKQGVDIQAPGDSRYSLRVSPPQGNDIWSTMTLTVNNANSVNDLTSNRYFFVASSNLGQAVHEVSVQASGTDGQQQKPKASAGFQLSTQLYSVSMFLCIAMASVFGRP